MQCERHGCRAIYQLFDRAELKALGEQMTARKLSAGEELAIPAPTH